MSPDPCRAKANEVKMITMYCKAPLSQLSGYLDVNKETIIGALNMRRISY